MRREASPRLTEHLPSMLARARPEDYAERLRILLYPCNLLGYVRLGLIGVAGADWLTLVPATFDVKLTVILLLLASSALDALDGPLARRFNHATRFGEWLDQLADLLGATLLWLACGFWLSPALLTLEWATGLVTLLVPHRPRAEPTAIGRSFMHHYFANRQRNPFSALANASHLAFPIALFLGPGFEVVVYGSIPGLVVFELATLLILASHVRGKTRGPSRSSGI